ncbi:hypothetical protein CDL12_13803 [Handroanthus impetiginosus]|uniref:Uncharacterized protein n=1 Tax=Handroanthus impetiginosus TaxID=429701 RepID=A0A2G9H7R8_9LAMI|nr:hypothetical protein CDL12_13803 [Handroanthus impetiginosus]
MSTWFRGDDQPGCSLRACTGHSAGVMSLDFHPNKEGLICSCDVDGEIRYWSIYNGSCARDFMGGTAQVRFQPRLGRYLAAAAVNVVSILDAEIQACRHSLKGHTKPNLSVCWDPSGELPASVSKDSVRIWTMRSASEGDCLHELSCNGNEFHSRGFHAIYSSLLVILLLPVSGALEHVRKQDYDPFCTRRIDRIIGCINSCWLRRFGYSSPDD